MNAVYIVTDHQTETKPFSQGQSPASLQHLPPVPPLSLPGSAISHTNNYSASKPLHIFARSETLRQVGWRREWFPLCLDPFTLWQSSERGLHHHYCGFRALCFPPPGGIKWTVPSDKDRAFQQFSKQEIQTHSHTSLKSNSSTSQSPAKKKKKKTLTLKNHQRPCYHQVIWLLTMSWLIPVRHFTRKNWGSFPFLFFFLLSNLLQKLLSNPGKSDSCRRGKNLPCNWHWPHWYTTFYPGMHLKVCLFCCPVRGVCAGVTVSEMTLWR